MQIKSQQHVYRIPTVKFNPDNVTETVKADLLQNIKLLKEISSDDFGRIYGAALRSITAGRKLDVLYQALLTIDGMSERRAAAIALSLNNKAAALMQAERQERLGIKYAVWTYSGAPCGDPEQDAAHRAADGKPYVSNKGMLLNCVWTWPGREDGCKCFSRPLITGFDGYAGGTPDGFVK